MIINTCNGGGGETSDCETGAAGEEDCNSLSFTLSLRTLREAKETDIIDQILLLIIIIMIIIICDMILTSFYDGNGPIFPVRCQ